MKLVISQPMYLPWRGIFEQIKLCDKFVFYDDVQIPKGGGKSRGFISRVQIKTERDWEWLSVHIKRSGEGLQLIKNAFFTDLGWKNRHMVKIKQAYQEAKFFNEIYESLVLPIYNYETELLSEFCINSTKIICNYLDLHPLFYISSDLNIPKAKDASQRVLEICLHFKTSEYITGHGAKNYINYAIFEKENVAIKYMEYKLTPYPQLHGKFNPFVSILDLLFNVGKDSNVYLDSKAIYWKNLNEFKYKDMNIISEVQQPCGEHE